MPSPGLSLNPNALSTREPWSASMAPAQPLSPGPGADALQGCPRDAAALHAPPHPCAELGPSPQHTSSDRELSPRLGPAGDAAGVTNDSSQLVRKQRELVTLEPCVHSSPHPPRTECDKTTHFSYLLLSGFGSSFARQFQCLAHSYLIHGLCGSPQTQLGFTHTRPALLSAWLWCPSKAH